MSVSRKDREAYEKGVEDSKKDGLTQFLSVEDWITENVFYSSSERAAYEKGLRGEQLDEDKDEPEEPSRDWFATGETSSSESESFGSDDSDLPCGESSPSDYTSTSPPGKESGWVLLLWFVLVGGLCFWVYSFLESRNNPATSSREVYFAPRARPYNPEPPQPPEYIADYGACPFEGCVYGQRWKAGEDVQAFTHRPDRPDTPVSTLQKHSVISKGQWLLTLNGILLAKRHEGRVGKDSTHGWEGGPAIHIGQAVPLYSTSGENCWKSWAQGRFFVICNPEYKTEEFSQEWWVKVLLPDQTEVWVSSENPFISQEFLNDSLGQKIASTELTLEQKLEAVDELVKQEADLNGNAGQHGLDPVHAAIESKDIGLMGELLKRGMTLRGKASFAHQISQVEVELLLREGVNVYTGERCPAYSASQIAVSPGGPEMLEFLLENGLDLSCMGQPAIMAFLVPGIATPEYNLENAEKVAALLVSRGGDIYATDRRGRNVFDLLTEPQIAIQPHTLKLKEKLTHMAVNGIFL